MTTIAQLEEHIAKLEELEAKVEKLKQVMFAKDVETDVRISELEEQCKLNADNFNGLSTRCEAQVAELQARVTELEDDGKVPHGNERLGA